MSNIHLQDSVEDFLGDIVCITSDLKVNLSLLEETNNFASCSEYCSLSPAHSSDSGVDTFTGKYLSNDLDIMSFDGIDMDELLPDFGETEKDDLALFDLTKLEENIIGTDADWDIPIENSVSNDKVETTSVIRVDELSLSDDSSVTAIEIDHPYAEKRKQELDASSLPQGKSVMKKQPNNYKQKREENVGEIRENAFQQSSTSQTNTKRNTRSVSRTRSSKAREVEIQSSSEPRNRSAEMARLNRLRKKRYMENLEKEVSSLRANNSSLQTEKHELKNKVEELEEEVMYLRNVLANQSMLSSILRAVSDIPGIDIQANATLKTKDRQPKQSNQSVSTKEEHMPMSLRSRKRPLPADSNTNSNPKNIKSSDHLDTHKISRGVCFHVSQDKVSIEFCHHCGKKVSAVGQGSK